MSEKTARKKPNSALKPVISLPHSTRIERMEQQIQCVAENMTTQMSNLQNEVKRLSNLVVEQNSILRNQGEIIKEMNYSDLNVRKFQVMIDGYLPNI